MKFQTFSNKLIIISMASMMIMGAIVANATRVQAQALDPYPSLYTATTQTTPYFSMYSNGYDLFSQQINQFMSSLYGSVSNYLPGMNYMNYQIPENRYSVLPVVNNNFDEPEVTTDDAENIERRDAELNGEIDMNDAEDGTVFFVYGEDEDQIEDVERDYDSYSDVDEDGNDLQKVKIETGFDGDDTFSEDIEDLDPDTQYYFTLCVAYEDGDEDEVLTCGRVEEFETDN